MGKVRLSLLLSVSFFFSKPTANGDGDVAVNGQDAIISDGKIIISFIVLCYIKWLTFYTLLICNKFVLFYNSLHIK